MEKIIAKKDFTLDGVVYIEGDEIKIKDIAKIKELNEKGFIIPLNLKQIVILERELKNTKEEE